MHLGKHNMYEEESGSVIIYISKIVLHPGWNSNNLRYGEYLTRGVEIISQVRRLQGYSLFTYIKNKR